MYDICAETDQGRVRKNNEDAVAFDAITGLCLLADGMGGYNAGEVASGMAVSSVQLALGNWLALGTQPSSSEMRRALEASVKNANKLVFDTACTSIDYQGMGTTLVVAIFQNDRLVLGHIGDSRCYRLRGRSLTQITRDHSLLQEHVDAGLITARQALSSPHKNLITRALGVEESVQVDIDEHRVELDDVYLLCTDGLHDMVPDTAILEILTGPELLADKARLLVESANAAGGHDNISVLLVRAVTLPGKRGILSRMLGKIKIGESGHPAASR